VQDKTKNGKESAALNETPNWFESAWHYVCVGYGGRQMGLLVETDDEEEAWRRLKTCARVSARRPGRCL
jgi:hypothetical protein